MFPSRFQMRWGREPGLFFSTRSTCQVVGQPSCQSSCTMAYSVVLATLFVVPERCVASCHGGVVVCVWSCVCVCVTLTLGLCGVCRGAWHR